MLVAAGQSSRMLFGWYDADLTAGAISMSPPYELDLACVPDELIGELVAAMRARATCASRA